MPGFLVLAKCLQTASVLRLESQPHTLTKSNSITYNSCIHHVCYGVSDCSEQTNSAVHRSTQILLEPLLSMLYGLHLQVELLAHMLTV